MILLMSLALVAADAGSVPPSPESPVVLGRATDGLPMTLSAGEPAVVGDEAAFSIGAAGGYLHAKEADRGTWFAGAQARLHFLEYFAGEGAITFHDDSYQSGKVHVTQYPVQVSGMLYPIPDGQFRPYVVAGVGWYYTRTTYSGTLGGISDRTDHVFGGHAGAGLEVRLGRSTSLDADIRYVFMNLTNAAVKNGDYDYWQVTFGLNFFF